MIRLVLMCFVLCVVYGNTENKKKDRVHVEEPLSDLEHDDENHDYDHEAFLGKDDAKDFDKLAPEESQRRLSIIVDKINTNKDAYVTEDELTVWIRNIQLKSIYNSTESQRADVDDNKDQLVEWEEYKKVIFSSYLDDPDASSDGEYNFTEYVEKDERRFRVADRNKDLKLDKDEFAAFIYPEEFEVMYDNLVQETINEIDKNGDGFIDMKEYIDDIYTPEEGDQEPDWVETERSEFRELKDKNNDGKLDKAEVLTWILPEDEHQATSEAKHLLTESDANQDGKLTKQEILEKYEVFVGSQATEYGEALMQHDEF